MRLNFTSFSEQAKRDKDEMDSLLKGVITIVILSAFAGLSCYGAEDVIKAVSRVEPNRKPAAGTAPKVTGTVQMLQLASGGPTFFKVDLTKVGEPFQEHAVHIHEYGDIYTQGCKSAGGHFNPLQAKDEMGDLGKLTTDAQGNIHVTFQVPQVSLIGPYSVIGRSIVIHAATKSKPPQIGCGVVFLAPVKLGQH